jgi:signal transduction histidine kinase
MRATGGSKGDATRRENLMLALPVVAALALFGIWALLDARELDAARRQVELATRQAAVRLQDYVQARLLVVSSLAHEVGGGLLAEEEAFVAHAESLQAQLGGFLAVNRIDGDGRILWVSPRGPNALARDRNVFQHPDAATFARAAAASGNPSVTGPLLLFQGRRGFATYFPLSREGRFAGFVNGVFDSEALVQASLRMELLEDYEIRVSDEGQEVFGSPGYAAAEPGLAASRPAAIMGRVWQVDLRPDAATLARVRPRRQDLWLGLTEATCLVAGLLAFGWRRSRVAQRRLEAELRQANKMEALGRFAGGVAHDMNNLLTAVTGNAELARDDPALPSTAREPLDEILKVAQRGAEMVRSLVAFSRSEPVAPRVFDPANQVRAFLPMVRHLARGAHVLRTELAEGLGLVRMDPTQLDQILLNLVVNAVDAMPEGGTLTIRLRAARAGGDGLVLEVEDTGVGIPAHLLDAIFEPFFSTKADKGTGLGLAQVWDCAQRAGGRVAVQSEVGRGACFQVWLPRLELSSRDLPVAQR